MEEISNKYKKHLLLVLFGFKSQEDLDAELTRYSIHDIEKLEQDILEKFKIDQKSKSYLISLIPRNKALKLPNRTISTPEDLIGLKEFIQANPNTMEIWQFEKANDGIIGRFVINSDDEQILEQIWSPNHRQLENYNSNSDIPLIRASRQRWYTRYSIDNARNIPVSSKEDYMQSFFLAIQEIERNREKIEIMQEIFLKYGVNQLSLEYRLDNRGFSFIDWDSSNDKKILANLLRENHLKGTDAYER